MSVPIPKLDDLTWEDLVNEGRSLIIGYDQRWTNHNTADPGITLMELFAYLSEMLLYRVDQVTVNIMIAMLKLINGQEWVSTGNLDADKRSTVLSMRGPSRAVTTSDYEQLALAANAGIAEFEPELVARAKCISNRNLTNERPASLDENAAGHFSVIVLPNTLELPSNKLLRTVREYLEPARLLTARVHVVAPRFVKVGVRLRLVAGAGFERARTRKALEQFLHPLEGGPDGKGWPFGRNVYVSEIYELLMKQPGVTDAGQRINRQTREPEGELNVDPGESWRLKRNSGGELESVELKMDELVIPQIKEDDFDVAIKGR
jgi:hypothetical protein